MWHAGVYLVSSMTFLLGKYLKISPLSKWRGAGGEDRFRQGKKDGAVMLSHHSKTVIFFALPAGYRNNGDGSFNNLGSNANFWSATENSGTNAWNRNLNTGNSQSNRRTGLAVGASRTDLTKLPSVTIHEGSFFICIYIYCSQIYLTDENLLQSDLSD